MKQILLIIAVVALVGCGKKEPVQPSAGIKLWEFATRGWVFSSPAIGSDGTVYVGSSYGNLKREMKCAPPRITDDYRKRKYIDTEVVLR